MKKKSPIAKKSVNSQKSLEFITFQGLIHEIKLSLDL